MDNTAVVFPDLHFPMHDEKAFKVALEVLKIVKPDTFINLGDVGEWESVSAWKFKGKKLPPLEYQLPEVDEDIELVNEGMDRIDDVLNAVKCENRVMMQGNHDEWLDKFVERNPYLPEYKFKNAIHLKDRGYRYFPYSSGKLYKLGKLNYGHGWYATLHHAKKHLDQYGQSLCYGHTHDDQKYTATRLGGTITAFSMGCLKDMSNEGNKWLRGRPNNWKHMIGVVEYWGNGDFRLEPVEIFNGNTSFRGERISV